MFHKIRSFFTGKPRYVQLSQYDLNGIASSAWQRSQSRALALHSLEHQYPHLFINQAQETVLKEAARATEEIAHEAISTTPELLTTAEAFQEEAPLLDTSAAREATVGVMETMATAQLVEEQVAEETTLYTEQQQRIIDLQRQIAGLRSTAPASDREIREVMVV